MEWYEEVSRGRRCHCGWSGHYYFVKLDQRPLIQISAGSSGSHRAFCSALLSVLCSSSFWDTMDYHAQRLFFSVFSGHVRCIFHLIIFLLPHILFFSPLNQRQL